MDHHATPGSGHRHRSWRWMSLCALVALASSCGPSYQHRIVDLRESLSAHDTIAALDAVNAALGVDTSEALPSAADGVTPLLLLERGMLLHGLGDYTLSSRDLQRADASLEVVDLAQTPARDIAEFMFSDAAANYRTPPYEKLMVNTVNMLNYLAVGDLAEARVEARRAAVLKSYFAGRSSPLALTAYLAGFVYEHSGDVDEALLWYGTASDAAHLVGVERALAVLSRKRPGNARAAAAAAAYPAATPPGPSEGELLVVVEAGRAPYWVEQRIPVGAAVVVVSADLTPEEHAHAEQMALEGLLKWVNFPELVVADPSDIPDFEASVGGRNVALELALDVETEAMGYYSTVRPRLILAALTRLLTRAMTGATTRAVVGQGREGGQAAAGFLAGLLVEGAMVVADTPDTRSWNTLPRVWSVGRVRLPAGTHEVVVGTSRGEVARRTVTLPAGGFGVVVVSPY